MNRKPKARASSLPVTSRDYLTRIFPRSTADDRRTIERLLVEIVSHQDRWAGLQRSTACEQVRAMLGRCDCCTGKSVITSGFALVPIQMADSIVGCLLANDECAPLLREVRRIRNERSGEALSQHMSVEEYCRRAAEPDWPAGYAAAFSNGLRELVWDFDDVRYPVWVLQSMDLLVSNRYPSSAPHAWRPLLARDERVWIQCSVRD